MFTSSVVWDKWGHAQLIFVTRGGGGGGRGKCPCFGGQEGLLSGATGRPKSGSEGERGRGGREGGRGREGGKGRRGGGGEGGGKGRRGKRRGEGGILGLGVVWLYDIGSPTGWPHTWTGGERPLSGARAAVHPCPPPPPTLWCVGSRSRVACCTVSSAVAVGVFVLLVIGRPLRNADSRMLSFHALSGPLCRTHAHELGFLTPGGPFLCWLSATSRWALHRPLVGLMSPPRGPGGFWGPLLVRKVGVHMAVPCALPHSAWRAAACPHAVTNVGTQGPAAGALLHSGCSPGTAASGAATVLVPQHMGSHCSAACPHPVTNRGTMGALLPACSCTLAAVFLSSWSRALVHHSLPHARFPRPEWGLEPHGRP